MEETTPQTPDNPLTPVTFSQESSTDVSVQVTPPAKSAAATGRWKKIIGFAILAGAFGAVGYFVRPYAASALSNPQAAQDDSQVKQFQTQRKQLEEKARDLADRLQGLEESLQKAQKQDQEQGLKLQAAQSLITDLDEQLALADCSNEPLQQELAAAQAVADQTTAKLTEASSRIDGLSGELSQARGQLGQLQKKQGELTNVNDTLSTALRSQGQQLDQWRELAATLEFGQPVAKPAAARLGEQPLTQWELVYFVGQPSMIMTQANNTEMHWGSAHQATLVDRVVVSIDGKPASRKALFGLRTPQTAGSAGDYRLGANDTLRHSELVGLFGRPVNIAGTGERFTATWQIGAWGRTASATVVNGVVSDFDGRPADSALLCSLVHQRAAAYAPNQAPVASFAASCRAAYGKAATLLAEQVKQEALSQAKDGVTLKSFTLAPLESVGSWAGLEAGGLAVRTVVTTTWSSPSEGTWTTARYAAVNFGARKTQPLLTLFEERN